MTYSRPVLTSLLGLYLFVVATTVAAQESGATSTDNTIEEITVKGKQVGYYDEDATSALKLSVPLMETPVSVFIINDELIADQQSFRLDQVLQNDSSVQKANNFLGAYSSYKVRGFELANGSNYLRDGRSFFHLAAPPMELVQRVEVLKGPASVLYGTLAPGGLVNQISKKPTTETTGSFKVTGGSYDFQHLHLDVGGSINESGTLRYRINAATENSESNREFFNGEAFETKREIYGIALAWDVGDSTTFKLNHDDTSDERPQDNGTLGIDGQIVEILPYDMIYNQPWSHYNSEVSSTLVEIDHAFNENWNISAGYSEQDFMRDRYDNQTRSFDPDTGDNTIRARRRLNKRDYTTIYADLSGELHTGSVLHNFLIGAEQIDIDRDDNEIESSERVTFDSNIFGDAYPDPRIAIGNVKVVGQEVRKGFYLQDMMELGEQWRLLLGGRYDDFDTSIAGDFDVSNFTPRVGVLFIPHNGLSLYGSYSESFEPNAPVGGGYANEGEALDPTVGDMIEVGLKYEAYDGNLLLTTALFDINRDGSPIENLATNTIEQRGQQNHKGMELSASGLVGENLSLTASATYLDTEIVEDDDPTIVGNTPSGVPDISLSLWGEYQFSNSYFNGFSLQAGIFYESDRPVDDANSFDLDAYYRVDLGGKYVYDLVNGNSLITRLTVSNALDEEYYKARSAFSINPERPREIRASLQYKF